MINYEIFEKWWEIFRVIWWGIARPSNKTLQGEDKPAKQDILIAVKDSIDKVIIGKDESKKNELKKFINDKIDEENERKKTIESKAHSLIGHTSIAISFLLAAISLGTSQYQELPLLFKISIWIVFLLIIICFVSAGLHARNVVTLTDGYASEDINDYLDSSKNEVDLLAEKFFISKYNSYLNNVKGTYLKFSHWYFKFGFIVTLLVATILPPLIMVLNSSQKAHQEAPKNILYYDNHIYRDTLNIISTNRDTLRNPR